MSIGYIYMILSLSCFGLIGIFAKYADLQGCRPSAVYTLAYSWSLLFDILFMLIRGAHFHVPSVIYAVALPFGAVSAIGGIVFMAGIRYGKISTSWLIINLSAAIPAAGSVMIYHETMTVKMIAVLLLAIASILLLWKDKREDEKGRCRGSAEKATSMRSSSKWMQLMLLAFVANGLGPFGLKVIAEKGLAEHYHFQYLLCWYAGGLAFGLAALLTSHSRFQTKDMVMAFAIGVGSFGGQLFSVLALGQKVPGYIVFPITTGGNLFLVAAAGVLIFREKIGRYGIAGIVTGILPIVLLSLS